MNGGLRVLKFLFELFSCDSVGWAGQYSFSDAVVIDGDVVALLVFIEVVDVVSGAWARRSEVSGAWAHHSEVSGAWAHHSEVLAKPGVASVVVSVVLKAGAHHSEVLVEDGIVVAEYLV